MSHVNQIKTYICEELAPDIDAESLPNDCDLLMTGIVDSLSLVRLVTWLEEEYDIPTGDMNIAPEDFSSVDKVDSFITKHSPSEAVQA